MKKRIAEGDYIFWIVSADAAGRDQLAVTFLIVSGDRDALGRQLARQFNCSGTSVQALTELLEACGKTVPRKKVRLNLDRLAGLECAGTVTDDGYGQRIISAFFSIGQLESKRRKVLGRMQMFESVTETRYLM